MTKSKRNNYFHASYTTEIKCVRFDLNDEAEGLFIMVVSSKLE